MSDVHNDSFFYTFPAIRGVQAGRVYYITMCPLDTVGSITKYNEEDLPPDFRAQRTLNKRRIPEITKYILDNPKSYVFSALTVSVDSSVRFEPYEDDDSSGRVGKLIVPVSTKFVINDGQHRRAAIAEALRLNKTLFSETIPLVIFVDSNLGQSQQMFADLNRYAIRPTKSLSILYDQRDSVVAATLEIIAAVVLFRNAVEYEKTSLSNRSTNLFTLSNVYEAICRLLNKSKGCNVSENEKSLAIEYWSALSAVIPEWNAFTRGLIKSSTLRRNYVHSHGVVLVSLGIVGNALISQYPESWKSRLISLSKMDWRRSNTDLWEGIAMEGGKISKAHLNLKLTSIAIKEFLGVHLAEEEIEFRNSLMDRRLVH